jgi:hypothetical protein
MSLPIADFRFQALERMKQLANLPWSCGVTGGLKEADHRAREQDEQYTGEFKHRRTLLPQADSETE